MRDQGPYALCPWGVWGRGLPTVWGTREDVDMMEHGPLPTESPGHWPVWLSESGSFSSSYFWLPHGLQDLSSPARG